MTTWAAKIARAHTNYEHLEVAPPIISLFVCTVSVAVTCQQVSTRWYLLTIHSYSSGGREGGTKMQKYSYSSNKDDCRWLTSGDKNYRLIRARNGEYLRLNSDCLGHNENPFDVHFK